jgi:hypothetical protein
VEKSNSEKETKKEKKTGRRKTEEEGEGELNE